VEFLFRALQLDSDLLGQIAARNLLGCGKFLAVVTFSGATDD